MRHHPAVSTVALSWLTKSPACARGEFRARGGRGDIPLRLVQFSLMALAICVGGCADSSPKVAKNDEAMKRALKEGTRIDIAAREYFYPKRIVDYFDGMDVVSTREGTPDQLFKLRSQGEAQAGTAQPEKPTPGIPIQASVNAPDLNESETLGRNTWMIWCAGNEGFWDWLATDSLGFIDLLKLANSQKRNERFHDGGLINEPHMDQAREPPPGEFGLWLDRPQDPRHREWRRAYVTETFKKIAEGKHKSQIGLKVRDRYGDENGRDLFVGDPNEVTHAGYDSPSSYMSGHDPSGKRSYDDTTEGESNYGRYDDELPPPDIYGLSSGIVGLRLFPNPYFDKEAQARWDARRYYTDTSYSSDPNLVRPYRVGVSCAYCHASFHPLNPPQSVNHPEWSNISGSIGAQYLRIRMAFGNLLTKDQFVYHLLDSQPPGTIDTSLIASDNINNPNTMNAVFNLPQRALLSFRNPRESLADSSAGLPSLWRHPELNPPADAVDAIPEAWRTVFENHGLGKEIADSNNKLRRTPRILLDGSDSIGAWGALARVYLNIGSYWEQWNEIQQPVIGFTPQRPFRLKDCETHSVYWNATKLRVGGLRDYFLKVTPPMPLLSTPDGHDRIRPIEKAELETAAVAEKTEVKTIEARERGRRIDVSKLAKGREVFARNCIVCHSSIQPESSAVTLTLPPEKPGENEAKTETADTKEARLKRRSEYEAEYAALIVRRLSVRNADAKEGEFWEHDPGQWLRDPEYIQWATAIVEDPAFWKWNYLSTDYRIPINVVGTNSARAMATNGLTGHMWEDFSSDSYRSLPSPGPITYFNPYLGPKGMDSTFTPRHKTALGVPAGGGGPGYYRVPSLVSIWATAPFLHNNSLGLFNNDPSVNGRLDAFDDAIHKLLWPEKRLESSSYNGATPERLKQDHGLIWRTSNVSHLTLEAKRVPYFLKQVPFFGALSAKYSWLYGIAPLWLPTVMLLAGALLILLLSNSRLRYGWGYGVLATAIVLLLVFVVSDYFPACPVLGQFRQVQPRWFPVATLVGLGITLLLPLSATCRRYVGYLSVIAALLIGTIVYFDAGKLGDLSLGPIPKGTPVNLLANFNSEADRGQQSASLKQAVAGLAEIKTRHLGDDEAKRVLKEKVAPALMDVNKCPDFVMDKGHYFDWFHLMTDDDKHALIELLKTF